MRHRKTLLVAAAVALIGLAGCLFVENLRPIADFTATPSSGTTPLTVSFDASDSEDPDGFIVDFLWDFGDGQTSSLSVFPFDHQYSVQSDSRVFTVVLRVVDDDGATDTAVRNITVNP